MSGALQLARLEIVRRWQVLAAGLAAGLLPLAAPLVFERLDPTEVRFLMAGVIALIFTLVVGGAVGATMVASETAEGRMGFYFARPLSGLAIWAGKLAGSMIVVVGAALAVLLPSTLLAGGPGQRLRFAELAGLVLGTFAVLVLAHALAVAWRSRSRLLVADAAGVAAAGAMAAWLLTRLLGSAGGDAFLIGSGLLAVLVVLSAAVAGAVQIARGRVDLQAGHRALFDMLAAGVAISLLAVAGFSHWYTAVDLGDLDDVEVVAASAGGPWVAVATRARFRPGYYPTLLVNSQNGVVVRLPRCNPYPASSFSRDGGVFAWIQRPAFIFPRSLAGEVAQRFGGGAVRIASLDASPRQVLVLPIEVSASELRSADLVLSDDGSRMILIERRAVSVYELPSGRLLASAAVPEDATHRRAYFLDAGRVRAMFVVPSGSSSRLEFMELDIADRQIVARHDRELGEDELVLPRVNLPTGRMLLNLRTSSGWRRELADAATGGTVATLDVPPPWTTRSLPSFVSDGRVVIGLRSGHGLGLAVFAQDGALQRIIELSEAQLGTWLVPGVEVAPGTLTVLVRGGTGESEKSALLAVDLDRGEVRRVGEGLRPAIWGAFAFGADPTAFPAPGSPASRLLIRDHGRLALLDPATLKVREVAPR